MKNAISEITEILKKRGDEAAELAKKANNDAKK
jgi:hypothetical protein